ncbi:MAG: glycosyltransferase family 2 protein [Microcoleus sp. SIO2G3]|nr:glycosyltransferase family 2 protein [Microcoleus sp. SIO2G3]
MNDCQLQTPIVFVIFKRPNTTEKVFEVIRQIKPSQLLVIADGARADRPDEAEKCAAARAVIDCVDWDCEIFKNYSDINLGCAKRVSSGLDWVFNIVEEAIILEDDCVPHPTFFRFCEELLERYRYDSRIASISGQNVQFGRKRTEYSYYFSRYNHCWGWATWRRAWQHFDFHLKLWPEIKEKKFLHDILDSDPHAVEYWTKTFQSLYDGSGLEDSWAHRWTFACWINSSLGVLSNENLISNIGFGLSEATHDMGKRSPYNSMPTQALQFPLKHPPFLIRDRQADSFTHNTLFNFSVSQRIKLKVQRSVKQLLKGL